MPHSVHHTPRGSTPVELSAMQLPVGKRWWNNNLPQTEWTDECPDFLLGQSEKNIGILSGKEEDYKWMEWPEVQHLIKINKIDGFQRSPNQLRRYLKYLFKLKSEYGSVLSFVQHERLHWDSITPSVDKPFANSSDYKTLFNDWPYGIDKNIVHLVVWTKFLIDDDPKTGDITGDARALIEDFVTRTFCENNGVDRKDLIWFKNWKSIKSVHALEHFHVMLYKAPTDFVSRMTEGDRPMSELFEE